MTTKIKNGKPKKKANGEGSLYYSKALQKWVGQYTTSTGRKTITQKKNENVSDFKKRFNKCITQINDGTYIERSKITFINILKEYVENKYTTNQVSASTYKRDLYILREIEKTCTYITDMPIQRITVAHIKKVLPNMIVYSNSIIEKMYRFFNKAFKIALSERLITFNPMENEEIKKPKSIKQTKRVEALTVQQHKKLLEVLLSKKVNKKYADIILLQLYTGMRIGEVLALSKDCINIKESKITVYRTLTRDINDRTIIGKTTKTVTGSRTFYINESALNLCKKILTSKVTNINNLLFFDYSKNNIITPSQVNCYLKRLNEKYKIADNIHTHMLRHTFATRFIEAGGNPKVLQVILGHKKIEITLNTYASVLNDFSFEETNKYSNYLQKVGIM